ncbi:hypothetical protein HK096_010563, partial [Nowakowskiella sp. JEL0078]
FVARSHTLALPDNHNHASLVTTFDKGVPAKQVRELAELEKDWDFWTSSDAFYGAKPESGLKAVPHGQAWVISRGSSYRVVAQGSTLILPYIDNVKAVKNTHAFATGVITPKVILKDGSSVNAYAVVYLKVTDFLKSTTYIDPETNKNDSERAAAKLIKRTLEHELSSLISSSTISESEKAAVESKLRSVLEAKQEEYGLAVDHVEFRGVFDSALKVGDKIRALSPIERAPDAPGHGLSADYWSEVISPPYFQRNKFGSSKEPRTPAAVTLEWCIPSPPDYHHFNELPRMTADPPNEKAVKEAAAH